MGTINQSSEVAPLVHQQIFTMEMNEGQLTKLVVAIFMCLLFICINSIMFHTLMSKPVFRELPRYILFAHMLCSDTVQLMLSSLLYILALSLQKIPKAVCSLIVLMSAATARVSALNLGVMSLERYAAICFPLRHSELATQKMTAISIAIIWSLACISPALDILYALIVSPVSFRDLMFCTRESFILAPWQRDVFQGLNGFFFVAVTAIIVFTYISVILVARSASADKDSAKKALRTVLLHLGQLVLCLNSLLYGTIERLLAMASSSRLFRDLRYANFIIVFILPRCLSPLIYGLRDDAVRPLFLYYVRCQSQKVEPSVTAH
ncbi:odorant receptor 131-2-like [Alosa pseudoharengus]|uniref:odorant receptor 131-2-like n=1 Tax=Alosa pseudoharengus TaxID=34774 RepID=UPI003F88B092